MRMRRVPLALACLLLASASLAQSPDSAAQRLAHDAIIVDTHIDAPGILMEN